MDLKLIGNLILDGAIALIVFALWGFTVLGVSGSARRRGLPWGERIFWVALAVILPFIGAILYLLARITSGMAAPAQEAELPPIKDSTDVQLPPVQLPGNYSQPVHASRPPSFTGATNPPPPRTSGTNPAGRPVESNYYAATRALRRLVVTGGPYAGSSFTLDRLPVLIGRSSDSSVRLENDLMVSRRHAEISARGSDLYLRDLGSTHGTLINGRSVSEHRLSPGDTIQIGDSLLVLEQ